MKYDDLLRGRQRRENEPFSWGGCILLIGLAVITLAWLGLLGYLAIDALRG